MYLTDSFYTRDMTSDQRVEAGNKLSATLREHVASGLLKAEEDTKDIHPEDPKHFGILLKAIQSTACQGVQDNLIDKQGLLSSFSSHGQALTCADSIKFTLLRELQSSISGQGSSPGVLPSKADTLIADQARSTIKEQYGTGEWS